MAPSTILHTIVTAKRALLGVLAGCALLVALLLGERLLFEYHYEQRHAQATHAVEAMGRLDYLDEALTLSARIAVLTGDAFWRTRYAQLAPQFSSVLAGAAQGAPTAHIRQLAMVAGELHSQLYKLDAGALAALAAGDVATAHSLFDSPYYHSQKRGLRQATGHLEEAFQRFVEQDHAAMRQRSMLVMLVAGLLSVLGAYAVWRRVDRQMRRAYFSFERAKRRLSRLALHDSLTGLPNRRHLGEELIRLQALAGPGSGKSVAFLALDLDHFKAFNDRCGHHAGDAVLTLLARRMRDSLRRESSGNSCLARLDGDEFALIFLCDGDTEAPHAAAQRLLSAVAQPLEWQGEAVRLNGTIGVALFPQDASEGEELMRVAGIALQRAQEDAVGLVRFFKPEMDIEVQERLELEQALRHAIAHQKIEAWFQPLVSLATGAPIGFEALARWPRADGSFTPPDCFIPLVEKLGLVDALFDSILRQSCAEAVQWPAPLRVAVNVSAYQLQSPLLVDQVLRALQDSGLPPERLELELTESALVEDMETALGILQRLKAIGVKLALDDFGTGYASLQHLRAFPFDKIKIDRSFIQAIGSNVQAGQMANAIIGLGHSLNLATTAEGIEDNDHAQWLRAAGCDQGQGYLFGRAVAGPATRRWLEQFIPVVPRMPLPA